MHCINFRKLFCLADCVPRPSVGPASEAWNTFVVVILSVMAAAGWCNPEVGMQVAHSSSATYLMVLMVHYPIEGSFRF